MKFYYGVDFKEQREKLLNSNVAKELIENIIKKADFAIEEEYKPLNMSDYMLFYKTGDRAVFEKEYFKRRNNCSYISIAYWLTQKEIYKKTLIDLIFYICDEFTWCVPAHAGLNEKTKVEEIIGEIDLFQAETARLLTDITAMVGEKLPYYVNDRIKYEIRRRIIKPILDRKFPWQNKECKHNWAAVCAGGVGVATLHYAKEEEIKAILPLLNESMERFLEGYNDDGCCLEGYAYWNYGFGYFCIYAMAVLDYSNGKINLFNNEKVKQIALYPQRIRMGENKIVSFSDSLGEFTFSVGLFSLLRSIYGKEVLYPSLKLGTMQGNVYSVKEFLWFDTEYKEDKKEYLTTYFDNSQWFIKQNKKYSFAAKGGHNDEPHNHNDIGSFMIVTADDDIPLTDLGAPIYRKETFDPKYRYTILNTSSMGHSVPIINAQYQIEGANYKAKNVKAGIDYFELDIEGAYKPGIVKRINRKFTFKEDSITLCDKIEQLNETKDITERIISCTKPVINGNFVDLKTAGILFDKEKYQVSISEALYRNHRNTEDVNVFLIDFKPIDKKETKFEIEILIK